MRNRYPGTCYRCGERVESGDGHFERFRGGWRVQHASCAISCRGQPDALREADTQQHMEIVARGTGRRAQRARRWLRSREVPG